MLKIYSLAINKKEKTEMRLQISIKAKQWITPFSLRKTNQSIFIHSHCKEKNNNKY